ncbi:MAG: hypothetical protein SVU69_02535 [Pseudomonadota bacterium]|nr:hypothetical protein [Pseudomonadota bacterium]
MSASTAGHPEFLIVLNAVIVAVTDEAPRILTVPYEHFAASEIGGQIDVGDGLDALPSGPLDPERDLTLELALRNWVERQADLSLGYVEQLYTFGDASRDPTERMEGRRVISVAYLALVREHRPALHSDWREWYAYFPWEDWRQGRPELIDSTIAPALERWIEGVDHHELADTLRERVDINFGLSGAAWDPERVLDRYELLYEAGMVPESRRNQQQPSNLPLMPGRPMGLDHRRILATAMGRIRGKIKYRPVVFELLPPEFTLLQLQRVVEALSGVRLHKQNFRRLVEQGGLVASTGEREHATGGRPAKLFRFRRRVLRERPGLGVGLPAKHQ